MYFSILNSTSVVHLNFIKFSINFFLEISTQYFCIEFLGNTLRKSVNILHTNILHSFISPSFKSISFYLLLYLHHWSPFVLLIASRFLRHLSDHIIPEFSTMASHKWRHSKKYVMWWILLQQWRPSSQINWVIYDLQCVAHSIRNANREKTTRTTSAHPYPYRQVKKTSWSN